MVWPAQTLVEAMCVGFSTGVQRCVDSCQVCTATTTRMQAVCCGRHLGGHSHLVFSSGELERSIGRTARSQEFAGVHRRFGSGHSASHQSRPFGLSGLGCGPWALLSRASFGTCILDLVAERRRMLNPPISKRFDSEEVWQPQLQ